MPLEDVSVEVHEGQVTISGRRESEKEETGKTFHRVERQYGEFRRSVSLPIYSKMGDGDVSRVIEAVNELVASHRR